MPTVKVHDNKGKAGADIQLSDAVFACNANVPLMHQAALAELANYRQGTHSTRGQSELRGGGKKPYKQKGTGRARQGSTRAAQFRGGGTVFGPKPRSYRQQLNKKMRRAAIRQGFSDMVARGQLFVIDDHGIAEPKTKLAAAFLKNLGLEGKKALVITDGVDGTLVRAMSNLPKARVIPTNEISFYQLLNLDGIVVTTAALKKIEAMWGTTE